MTRRTQPTTPPTTTQPRRDPSRSARHLRTRPTTRHHSHWCERNPSLNEGPHTHARRLPRSRRNPSPSEETIPPSLPLPPYPRRATRDPSPSEDACAHRIHRKHQHDGTVRLAKAPPPSNGHTSSMQPFARRKAHERQTHGPQRLTPAGPFAQRKDRSHGKPTTTSARTAQPVTPKRNMGPFALRKARGRQPPTTTTRASAVRPFAQRKVRGCQTRDAPHSRQLGGALRPAKGPLASGNCEQ